MAAFAACFSEIIMHTGHNLSADAWALGCLMYELIVGKTPFAAAAEVVQYRGGRRVLSRAEDADSRIMAAVAEVQFKGMRLNPNALVELEAVPGSLPLVNGFLNPVPANRLPISLKPSSAIVKSLFFKDFDWDGLRDGSLVAPYVPPVPFEISDEEKERLRKEAEAAERAARQAEMVTMKTSYMDATVASTLSRADKSQMKKQQERRDEDLVLEAKHSPLFDPAEAFTGDQAIFAEF